MNARDAIYLHLMNQRYGAELKRVPRATWPPLAKAIRRPPIEVWRSSTYLLMVYMDQGYERLSIVRAVFAGERYADGVSWEDLQRLKRECGRGERWAVEVFPPERDVVNIQNMRHLWLLPEPPPFGWSKDRVDTGKGE